MADIGTQDVSCWLSMKEVWGRTAHADSLIAVYLAPDSTYADARAVRPYILFTAILHDNKLRLK